jgi:hypothetical protein
MRVVAYWRFQNGVDGGMADSSKPIEDSSGNDHHGRALGGPEYRSVNLPTGGLALKFDGKDDRVFVADDADLHLTKSFTIEAYVEIDADRESAARECHIVFRGDNRYGFDPWGLSVTQSGQLRFLVANALNETSVVHSPEPLPTIPAPTRVVLPTAAAAGSSIHANGVTAHSPGGAATSEAKERPPGTTSPPGQQPQPGLKRLPLQALEPFPGSVTVTQRILACELRDARL